MCLCRLLVFLTGFVIQNFDTLGPGRRPTFIVRGVCDVRNLKTGLDGVLFSARRLSIQWPWFR